MRLGVALHATYVLHWPRMPSLQTKQTEHTKVDTTQVNIDFPRPSLIIGYGGERSACTAQLISPQRSLATTTRYKPAETRPRSQQTRQFRVPTPRSGPAAQGVRTDRVRSRDGPMSCTAMQKTASYEKEIEKRERRQINDGNSGGSAHPPWSRPPCSQSGCRPRCQKPQR